VVVKAEETTDEKDDRVIYGKRPATEVEMDGGRCIVLEESDVLAKK
jgi:co-chaperonin GroES (HSP10)